MPSPSSDSATDLRPVDRRRGRHRQGQRRPGALRRGARRHRERHRRRRLRRRPDPQDLHAVDQRVLDPVSEVDVDPAVGDGARATPACPRSRARKAPRYRRCRRPARPSIITSNTPLPGRAGADRSRCPGTAAPRRRRPRARCRSRGSSPRRPRGSQRSLAKMPSGVVSATEESSALTSEAETLVGPPFTTEVAAVQSGPSSIAATVVPPAAQRNTTFDSRRLLHQQTADRAGEQVDHVGVTVGAVDELDWLGSRGRLVEEGDVLPVVYVDREHFPVVEVGEEQVVLQALRVLGPSR